MASPPVSRSARRPDRLAWSIALAFALGRTTGASAAAEPAPDIPTPRVGAESLATNYFSLADLQPPTLGSINSSQSDTELLLDVTMGGRSTRRLSQFVLRQGQLWALPADLRDLGLLIDPALALDAAGRVKLDDLAGLSYQYNPAEQSVNLEALPALRPQQLLGYVAPAALHANRGSGLLLNYDSYARRFGGQSTLSIGTQVRWFGRAGALEVSGVNYLVGTSRGYQRFDTHWSYSDPKRMWTWTAGDLISGGLSWTRPVRMGGLQWRRNFDVRPGLITFPIPRFASQVAVPSSLELLINNVRQFDSEIEDGPFVLGAYPSVSGAGEATLIVRDALGRLTQTSVPIYTDVQRLAPGTTDFSVEAGPLRNGLGDYGQQIAVSGSLRRGLSDTVTMEAHAESGGQLQMAGLGLVWSPFARWGVVTASAATSRGIGDGWQRAFGYQWNSRAFGLDVQSQRSSAGYRDLGSLDLGPGLAAGPMRAQDRVSGWLPLASGNLAFSAIRWRDSQGERSQIQTLSWSKNFGGRLVFSGSVFRDQIAGTGAGLSLSLPLGNGLDSGLGISQRAGKDLEVAATVRRNAPSEGGWGWQVQGTTQSALASGNFRGQYGEATLGIDRNAGQLGQFFQASGGLVWMDGQGFASRRIADAFALVSSAGVGQVPVKIENRRLGVTNAKGYLLVPDLHGWQQNLIAIDPDQLGINYRLPDLEQRVTPADQGGALVLFAVARVTPAMVVLLDDAGVVIPAGSSSRLLGGDQAFLVGLDGETYLDDLPAGGVLAVELPGRECRYHLPKQITPSLAVTDLGTLRCEIPP